MVERAKKIGGVTILKRPNKTTVEDFSEEEWDSSEEGGFKQVFDNAKSNESQETESPLDDTITVVDSAPKRRGRPPGSKNKGKVPQLVDQGLPLSALTLGVLNSGVVAMFGPDCGLLPGEQSVLQPPLARIIARLPAGDAAKAAVFIDPLVLIFGLAVWGRRIILLKQAEQAKRATVSESEFLRASGMAQTEPVRPIETSPIQFRNRTTPATDGIVEASNKTPTGGIPSQILQSFADSDNIGPTT